MDKIIDQNEYLSLDSIDSGSTFKAELIYHIERGEFLIIKKINSGEKQVNELIQQEKKKLQEIESSIYTNMYWSNKRR